MNYDAIVAKMRVVARDLIRMNRTNRLRGEITVFENQIETEKKLHDLEADVRAAGRLLARMGVGGPTAEDALKAVRAAVLIRHKFDIDDVKEIAAKHGVDL